MDCVQEGSIIRSFLLYGVSCLLACSILYFWLSISTRHNASLIYLIKEAWVCFLCKSCFKSVLHGCCHTSDVQVCDIYMYKEEGYHGVGARGEMLEKRPSEVEGEGGLFKNRPCYCWKIVGLSHSLLYSARLFVRKSISGK